jgi:MFS family permease
MQITNYVLPLYVVNSLGAKASISGVLSAVFAAGSTLCRFTTGGLTDRFGRRRMMIIGAAIVSACLFVLGFTNTVALIIALKFVQGIGHSINSTASNTAAADTVAKSRYAEGIGYYSLHSTLVGAFGATVVIWMMAIGVPEGESNYSLPLIVGGFCGLLAVAIAFLCNYEKKQQRPKVQVEKKKFDINDYIERRSLLPALLVMFQSICSGAGMFLLLYATELGLANAMGLYYIISTVVTLLTRFTIGRFIDNVRPVWVVIIPVFLQIGSYLLLAWAPGLATLYVSAVVTGLFGAMLSPTLNALSLRMAPASRAGAASATYWLGFDAGMAVGPTVFGIVVDMVGYSASYVAGAICMVIFAIVAFFVLLRVKPIAQLEHPEV